VQTKAKGANVTRLTGTQVVSTLAPGRSAATTCRVTFPRTKPVGGFYLVA